MVANLFTADKAKEKSLFCSIFRSFKNVKTGKGGSWAEREKRETLLLVSGIPVSGVWVLVLGELEREKPPIYSIKKTLLFHLEQNR